MNQKKEKVLIITCRQALETDSNEITRVSHPIHTYTHTSFIFWASNNHHNKLKFKKVASKTQQSTKNSSNDNVALTAYHCSLIDCLLKTRP